MWIELQTNKLQKVSKLYIYIPSGKIFEKVQRFFRKMWIKPHNFSFFIIFFFRVAFCLITCTNQYTKNELFCLRSGSVKKSNFVMCLKAPEHEYIFSKYSWNLIKNIILIIFWRVVWNYSNNCLHICVFMYVSFWKQKRFVNFNRFPSILLKKFEFQIKLVWFETWNFKFRLTSENEVFYISEIL